MRKEDADFVTINLPIPKAFAQESALDVKKKKKFKKISKEKTTRNPSADILAKYALPDNRSFQDNAAEDLLLPYRLYQKNLTKIIRKHRFAIKVEKKYEILHNVLRNRLHVDDPPDDVKAVTDIDDGYFWYLNSHPRTECIPLYKSLKCLYPKQIRMKQEIGYRRDDVLNIDENHTRELKRYQDSVQMYMEHVKKFESFISEDYEKSIACLKKSETLYSNLIDEKVLELKNLACTQFSVQSKLIGIDYLYYQQQKYGRFLYYISPPSWRAKHRDFACSVEIEAKGFDLGTSNEEDTFNVVFEHMKRECASGLITPALYFSQPGELMNIFDSTEKQQLHHFAHVAQLKPHMETLQEMIKDLKKTIHNDAAFIAHIIRDIEKLLDFDDERASQLETKFNKILHGSFYDSVAARDVIKLQMNLEWCFERVFREKSNTNIGSTAKALEDMYMEYAYKLEMFGNDETKVAFKQSLAEEQNMMKKAHLAAKELRLFERLEKSLMRAHGNNNVIVVPVPDYKRTLTRKSKAQQVEPVVRHSSQRQLSESEIEYLHLFTDWTEKDDPGKYLKAL